MTALKRFSSEDVYRIARKLAGDRRIPKNRNGWKTFCPLCRPESRRRRPRPTLSVTARDGEILVYCHRCRRPGVDIIRELVRRELLPNFSKKSSTSFTLLQEIRIAISNAAWNGHAKTTELLVLEFLIEIVTNCRKVEFGASVLQVADGAHV